MNALRTHVRTLKPRFVPLVLDGTKDTTIRPTPKREVRVGDLIDLRAWTGRPYWSPQRKVALGVVIEVKPVEIRVGSRVILISLGGAEPFHKEAAHGFARRDGFASANELIDWFKEEHGLPFKGVWIRWSLRAVAKK